MKNKILEYNNILVINEIKSLVGLIESVHNNINASIMILGLVNYIILFSIEAINYIDKTQKVKIDYNYKSQLKNSRARIKEYTKEYNGMIEDIKKINSKTYTEYYNQTSNYIKKFFPSLITNLGVYYYNGNIIGNTFLYEMDNKKIFLTNNSYDSKKCFSIAKECGQILVKILNSFNENQIATNINIQNKILSKDFDVYTKNNFLNPKIDVNCGLLLLNILSILNFYNYIIKNFDIYDSLKYRIGYCIFYRSYNNLKIIVDSNTNFNNLKLILKKYAILDYRTFRNGMFHYDLQDKLEEKDLIKNEMYCGLIKKQLNFSNEQFKNILNDYICEISNEINKLIIK